MTSWFWDSSEVVILAPGVTCFTAGIEYAHGGLSLQEALIPSLTVSKGANVAKAVALKDLKWSGMRLNVVLNGAQGFSVDIRSKVADPTTSFATGAVKSASDGHKTSILVDDDDALGKAAFFVVVDDAGQVIFKQSIAIGEN